MNIDLSCTACGGNRFSLDRVETDSSTVACEDCGSPLATLGALKQEVARAVASERSMALPLHSAD